MKYGFLKGHKVAECQDGQTQLMARFLKEGVVDKWRDSEAPEQPEITAQPEQPGTAETEAPPIPPEPAQTAAQEAPATEPAPAAQEPAQTAAQAGGSDELSDFENAAIGEVKPNGKKQSKRND